MSLLNGWLLAPLETKQDLLKRKKVLFEAPFAKEKVFPLPLYDLEEIEVCMHYSDESLFPWQGAALWEYFTEEGDKYPVIQLRTKEIKNFLSRCSKEEVLTHELVHAARFAFKEPFFEEMFAYQTSSSSLRRFWGSFFIYPIESVFFAAASLLSPLISIFLSPSWGVYFLISLFFFFFFRLLILHSFFSLCKFKLRKVGFLPLPTMIRLADLEIVKIALFPLKKIHCFFERGSQKEVRLEEIVNFYFKGK